MSLNRATSMSYSTLYRSSKTNSLPSSRRHLSRGNLSQEEEANGLTVSGIPEQSAVFSRHGEKTSLFDRGKTRARLAAVLALVTTGVNILAGCEFLWEIDDYLYALHWISLTCIVLTCLITTIASFLPKPSKPCVYSFIAALVCAIVLCVSFAVVWIVLLINYLEKVEEEKTYKGQKYTEEAAARSYTICMVIGSGAVSFLCGIALAKAKQFLAQNPGVLGLSELEYLNQRHEGSQLDLQNLPEDPYDSDSIRRDFNSTVSYCPGVTSSSIVRHSLPRYSEFPNLPLTNSISMADIRKARTISKDAWTRSESDLTQDVRRLDPLDEGAARSVAKEPRLQQEKEGIYSKNKAKNGAKYRQKKRRLAQRTPLDVASGGVTQAEVTRAEVEVHQAEVDQREENGVVQGEKLFEADDISSINCGSEEEVRSPRYKSRRASSSSASDAYQSAEDSNDGVVRTKEKAKTSAMARQATAATKTSTKKKKKIHSVSNGF